MDSSWIQENVEALQLIPHQQPIIEEEELEIQIIPIEDHADVYATLERLSFYKASQNHKLDYGGIIFNDLAVKLTNFVRHTSPVYARFISLILEKALGDSYVLSDEIGLKIPIMGNLIFRLDLSLLEVPISFHMVRVCQSEPDPAVVSEDVPGILLCDNVADGSPSVDPNLNEIVQKVKTKSITSSLDPKLKESTGV
ncbi:hypothetical protein Tco_1248738 [Tanacetum coccineum]